MRTSVASPSTASVSPTPNIRMNDTWAAIIAANEIDMINAAAVITRPVWANAKRHAFVVVGGSPVGCQPIFVDPRHQEHFVVH